MTKVLIVATTTTPSQAEAEIAVGKRPCIDYLDLQKRLKADVVDYSVYEAQPYRALERSDRLSRMAWGQAWYILRHWKNYDVVYSLGEDVGIPLEALFRLKRMRPRHILVAHNIVSPRKVPIIKAMNLMWRFDRVIVFSTQALDEVVSTYKLSRERVNFIYDAVDENFWQPVSDIVPEPGYALSIGSAKRDYTSLIEAVCELPILLRIQSNSQWYVGNESIRDTASSLPDNVEIGGHLTYQELRMEYSRAGFVIVPLLPRAHHSAGTVSIKEAMAMGKAVIVASNGGAGDYVLDGVTGLLVPAGRPTELQKAIVKLLKNSSLARRMGERGQTFLRDKMRYEAKIDWFASLAD